MITNDDYDDLACKILFSKVENFSSLLNEYNLEYRTNKVFQDIIKVKQKAIKAARGKTEHEISWFALYLKEVLKEKK